MAAKKAKKNPKWKGCVVLGLAGRKKVGKDSAADYLVERYNKSIKINFSDPILEEVNEMLAVHNMKIDPSNKEPYRRLLQEWGELRREEDEDYWNRKVEANIDRAIKSGRKLVLVCGPRAIPEFHMVKERGGELWKIIRPAWEAKDPNITEQILDDYANYDRYILNDASMSRFHAKIEQALKELVKDRI